MTERAATINYYGDGGSIIATDTIDVITPGGATPEPASALMLAPGLLLAGWLARTRSRR